MVYNYIRIVVIKMKNLIKITMILFIIIFMMGQFNFAKAFDVVGGSSGSGSSSGGGSESIASAINIEDYRPGNGGDDQVFKERVNVILGIIRTIGIVLSVIVLMVIGIRTMTGSAEEKSVYKEALPGYIIGVIMVIAITVLPSIIYSVVSNL